MSGHLFMGSLHVSGSKVKIRVPADSNSINLRHFYDFLRPQLSKFKTYANQMLLTRSSERLDSCSPTELQALTVYALFCAFFNASSRHSVCALNNIA